MSAPEASVAPWKRDLIEELKEKFKEYPVVGILNIQGIPAKQFQEMRELLRGKAEIKVSRRVLLRTSIEKASEEDSDLEDLSDYLEGPCALIFTEMDPFKLWKLLEENRTTAPAKVGMESPRDIVIPEGETDFQPGPVIGELQKAGIKARIQAGKVVVLEDSKIVEEGEEIPEEVVGVLARFGIEPREIGFELKAAYEGGTVFPGDMLVVDEEETFEKVQDAYMRTMALSFGVQFPTRQNVGSMIGDAVSRARSLAVGVSFMTPETAPQILSKSHSQMLNLASVAASEDQDAVSEELSEMLSASKSKTKKEEESKEEAEEEVTEEQEPESEEDEEEEEEAGLGGLFD